MAVFYSFSTYLQWFLTIVKLLSGPSMASPLDAGGKLLVPLLLFLLEIKPSAWSPGQNWTNTRMEGINNTYIYTH